MVDCVKMTARKLCKHDRYGLFEHLLFFFDYQYSVTSLAFLQLHFVAIFTYLCFILLLVISVSCSVTCFNFLLIIISAGF